MDRNQNLTRRSIVQAVAVLPAAAVTGTAANSAIKVGLIGAGSRGTYVASLFGKDPRARVTQLCDIFDSRLQEGKEKIPTAAGAATHKDFRDVLASDVDAVIIATPVYLHPEHFEAAVQARKHIYIEKPAAVDIAGCRRIMRAADSASGINISFGFQRRYGQVFQKAKAAVDSGAIGTIQMAHGRWLKGLPEIPKLNLGPKPVEEADRVRQWRWWRDTFGDSIVETFCHGIDVLNWFLGGHPSKAYGTGGRTLIKSGDIMDHVNVTFDYPRSVQASLLGSFITPPFYRSVQEEFFGSDGVIETSEGHWTLRRGRTDAVTEQSPQNITTDAVQAFLTRVTEGKLENTGVRGAESTLTAIMGRMAIDERREVTWEEVMRG